MSGHVLSIAHGLHDHVRILPVTEQATLGALEDEEEIFFYDPDELLSERMAEIPGVTSTPSSERAGLWWVEKKRENGGQTYTFDKRVNQERVKEEYLCQMCRFDPFWGKRWRPDLQICQMGPIRGGEKDRGFIKIGSQNLHGDPAGTDAGGDKNIRLFHL